MHLEAIKLEAKPIFQKLGHIGADFYLAGGTSLALQIGHRVSVDFDLFSSKKLPKNLLAQLEEIFKNASVIPIVVQNDQISVSVDGIQVTLLYYPFPLILPLVNVKPISLLSILEIATSKAYTLGRRATLKDYVDLYFIIKEKHCQLSEIMELAAQKYQTAFNKKLFLEQLVYLKDVEALEIVFLRSPTKKDEIESFFRKEIQKIKI